MSVKSLLQNKKVLVVDDEKDVLEVLEDLLSMCKVSSASSFEEAKKLLETQKFDIVVLDIMGVDGYALLQIAKRKGMPAVMLTGHAFNPPNLVKSIKGGAVSYIPKEEISRIQEFLNDVLVALEKGEDPWITWHERLPASFIDKRFTALWKDQDRDFWEGWKRGIFKELPKR